MDAGMKNTAKERMQGHCRVCPQCDGRACSGEVPGIHSITWNSEADQITITHDAHSRQGFALGAIIAAEFTAQHEGLLSTDDLFKF